MNIHGESSYTSTGDELEALFSSTAPSSGRRSSLIVRPAGPADSGFVEMPDADGRKAIEVLDGYEFSGRKLNVNEARPRQQR